MTVRYLVVVADEHFNVKYDGPAVEDHTMPITQLAASLVSLSEVFQSAQRALYPTENPVSLNIRATREGSFAVDLLLSDAVGSALSLFGSKEASAASTAATLTTSLFATTIGSIKFIKWRRGRKIKSQTDAGPGTIQITAQDNSTIIITSGVYVAVQDREFREKLEASLEPLKDEGINSMSISQGGEIVESVSRDELKHFAVPRDEGRILSDNTGEAFLQLLSVSFQDGNKWRFTNGDRSFYASMEDEQFAKEVSESRHRFAKSDILRVELHTIQRQSGTRLSTEYSVSEVKEVIPGGTQVPLPYAEFGDEEET